MEGKLFKGAYTGFLYHLDVKIMNGAYGNELRIGWERVVTCQVFLEPSL